MLYIFNIMGIDSNMRSTMSFREKIAWLSLIAMVAAYGAYFTLVSPAFLRNGASTGYFLALLGGILTVQAVLVTIASIVLAIQTGRDANAGKATFVSLLGEERARQQAGFLVNQAIEHLADHGSEADLLRAIARFAIERDH